jgi:hypothetical protein
MALASHVANARSTVGRLDDYRKGAVILMTTDHWLLGIVDSIASYK